MEISVVDELSLCIDLSLGRQPVLFTGATPQTPEGSTRHVEGAGAQLTDPLRDAQHLYRLRHYRNCMYTGGAVDPTDIARW